MNGARNNTEEERVFIYLDFAKVFDTGLHNRLHVEMGKQDDITGEVDRRIKRYSDRRLMRTVIGEYCCSSCAVSAL